MTIMQQGIEFSIRWAIRKDLSQFLEIENHSFQHPWTEEDFLHNLRKRNVIAMAAVAETSTQVDTVLGFVLYELKKTSLDILNLAVHKDHRRHHVGTGILNRMKDKLHIQRRQHIYVRLSEYNDVGHVFLRSQGFKALRVLRDYYEFITPAQDAYLFGYSIGENDVTT